MESALAVIVRYGYLVVFGSVFAEQIGLPFPSEPILLAAGGLVGRGSLDPLLVVVLASVASLIGDTAWYALGRRCGPRVLGWLCRLSLEPNSCVKKTERTFGRHGARSLVIAKFVPGLSTIAPPLAGVVGVPLPLFLLYSALGAMVWVSAYMGLGWLFTAQLEVAARYAVRMGTWAVALLAVVVAVYVTWKFVGRQRFLRQIRTATITPEELKRRLDEGADVLVVDVRDRLDFEAEPAIIPGALHLALDELEARHGEIPREREIVLYCTCPNEATSGRMALLLRSRGIIRVRPLMGGFRAWRERGYPLTALTPAMSGASHD
jgi:membrane protein DedA with SNARE-associated domain/rhodanese-related sulfurtransferase